MKCETLDSELKINCPDGFHKMSKDELAAENCYGDPPKLCLTNPERHIKISCSFKKYNPVAAALADQKGTAKAMQSKIARLMNGYNYSLKRFLTAGIGDFTADGFEYSYEAQGINMLARSFVIKNKRTYYYIHCYYRAELEKESLPVIDEIFAGNG